MTTKRILAVQALLVVGLLSAGLQAQNVGIGTATPHPSARLHIEDNARGLLIPNVALTGTDDATTVSGPATSLLVYNTATAGAGATAVTPGFYYWNGSQWVRLMDAGAGGGGAWLLTGNAGTNPATNFLGTTDAQPLCIRVNNQETFRFNPPGASAPAWSIQRGGGNQRGFHAVDLQSDRSAATQVASGNYSVIGGGQDNTASGPYATVGGGFQNTASGGGATIGGGSFNTASGGGATVGGGAENTANGLGATVGGGAGNTASGNSYATVGGGQDNTASGSYATVGGGFQNTASGPSATVGGGFQNIASGSYATVGGGALNTASNWYATVGGGAGNTASGDYSAIPGGYNLRVGTRSFGFSGQTSTTQTDLSANSNIAAFVDVNLWLYSRDFTNASQLRFYEAQAHSSGANYVALQAPTSLSANTTYTLPASLTTTNTVATGILQTDASGNLSWLDPSALGGGAAGWALIGNSITSAWNGSTGNFLGTTNAQPLVIATTNTTTPQPIQIWVGNQETFRFNPPGTSAPAWSIQRGGGNQRGLHAVDLQSARSAATQVASGPYSVIGGGQNNTASGGVATVGGGVGNTASGGGATVGGGIGNTASSYSATVGGGYQNTSSGQYATVGGGRSNTASRDYATVGGGNSNTASRDYATVGGGNGNTASGHIATVGGGSQNTASGDFATVGGGTRNTASGDYSAIPGGSYLRVGARSFGFSGQTSLTQTDLSANSNIAAFVDVDLWLYSRDFTNASQLRFYEAQAHGSGANYIALQAPTSLSANTTYTLPASLTTTNTVATGILQTDASGNLSWLDPSALGGGAAGWALIGNSITSAWNGSTGNFLGTTNAQPLVIATTNTTTPQPIQIWVGNQETFRFNPPGTSAPAWSIQRGGGNQRGLHAVDLQSARSAATQVASGAYSVIGGGQNNTASGGVATVGGGVGNTASGGGATVGGGIGNTASSYSATVGGGYQNTSSGQYATVGGGNGNTASRDYATVGGGNGNTASRDYATVGGGNGNTASGHIATVGGGSQNTASGDFATVGGGTRNTASGDYSAIPGGSYLRVGARSFGFSGQTSLTQTDLSANSNIAAFVDVDLWLYSRDFTNASQLRFYEAQAHGSGANYIALQAPTSLSANTTYTLPASLTTTNTVATGILQTDASGNLSWLDPSALGGGAAGWALIGNSITSAWNGSTGNFLGTTNAQPLVIATTNTTTPQPIQIWVGNQETFRFNPPGTSAPAWSIQRGGGNQRGLHAVDLQSARSAATQVASGNYSVIGGGHSNTASGPYATVGGGIDNIASDNYATVGGGSRNTANGYAATVGGGRGNIASGEYSVVPGGSGNNANANYNLVFGQEVDPSVTETHRVYFFSDENSGFLVINRLDGNYPIHVGTGTGNGNGAHLTAGGVWTNGSSRSFKERFVQYRPAEVLEKILQLPVEGYFYKGTEEYHITPMAEDFYRLFGTGVHEIIETDSTGQLVRRPNPDVDKYLAASDMAGVALLGIQALHEENTQLRQRVSDLEKENASLRARLERLETLMQTIASTQTNP